MSVRYIAFGEMAVEVDGQRHPLTRRRERAVLSVLLAAHGAPVAAERLVTEVWGDEATGQTLAPVQVAVSRLRGLLEPGRSARKGTRLVSTAAGYSLRADVADVDTWNFAARVEDALSAGSPGERLAICDEARGLWTAPPYADNDAPIVHGEITRLEELFLTLQEQRGRALLDLGRPEEAQRALAELVRDHPYRERMWSLLALAHYQSSRQADALETLRTLRERLADDLGVDPSEEIQQLEQAVLRQDPSLAVNRTVQPASAPAAAPASTSPAGTVGRDSVLDDAAAVLRSATAGPCARFLLVAGEPGIGKSRLVEDLCGVAEAEGARVLLGRCHEGDYAPALWPWLGIVRALVDGAQPAGRQPVEPDALLDPLLAGDVEPSTGGGGTGLRMFDAIVSLIARRAAEQQLLLVLEDIHWADATSLQLLRHLAGADLAAPVGVVCTRRTTEAQTSEPLVDTMAALARAGAERLRLDGLDTTSVGQLLDASVGAHDPRFDAVVADVTGGNPFFVLQYARLLQATPDLDSVEPESLPVPDGIRDVLHQRISRLPEDARRALSSAAVLGHRIDPELVAELSGLAVDDCLDLLDLGLTSGLVEEHAAGYAFVHALARETMYADVSAARRMRLHDRASHLLERHFAHEADATAEIAHHAHLAAPLSPEHAERACAWLGRAAGVATARHAHPEALGLWRQVLADAPADSVMAAEALCGVGAALLRMAHTVEARAAIEQAIALSRQLGRNDLVARAAGILNGAGVWSWREHGVMDEEFVAVLRAAAEETDDPAEQAQILATLQVELYYGWDSKAADQAGVRSVELARVARNPQLLSHVLLVRLIAAWGPRRADERLALADELLGLGLEGEFEVFAQFQRATCLYEDFQVDAADEAMRECAEKAAVLRHTGLEIPLAWWSFARARDTDDPGARALGEAALEVHRASGYIATLDLEILAAVRMSDRGEPVPDWARESVGRTNPGLRALVAHAVLESGDAQGARALLGDPAPPGATEYSVLAGHCLTVAVLAETGTPEEVSEAIERITAFSGRVANYGSVDHLGVVDHYLALGYAAMGDPRAPATAQSAVDQNRRLGCLPWLRRSEELLARLS